LAAAPYTEVKGYDPSQDKIVFQSASVNTVDFIELTGHYLTFSALSSALDNALDRVRHYAFAHYQGGYHSLSGDLGVLAREREGEGITSVVRLPGVTSFVSTVAAAQISNFVEFNDYLAVHPASTNAPTFSSSTVNVNIGGGFARGDLPQTFSALAAS